MWLAGWVLAHAEPGTISVPLEVWEQHTQPAVIADESVAVPIERILTGTVERGRLVGELTSRVSVSGGAVYVPVISNAVTLIDAQIDGRAVVPRVDAPFATVRAEPGEHVVKVRFVQGAPTERFSRNLELALPPGGPSAIDLVLPESPIEAVLSGGVITALSPVGEGTRVQGWLDAEGRVALGWQRRPEHTEKIDDADLVARLDALVEVGEDVATGVARVDYDVRSGSVDQLRLDVPPGVEVLEATGPGVLQWYTTRDPQTGGSSLSLLLREVVEDNATATVRFQYPVERGAELLVVFPRPAQGIPTVGVVGIEAPAGFEVSTSRVLRAQPLEPRDVPRSVLDLSADPVRAAFSFEEVPEIALSVERQPELPVITTRIDDLQGLTVLVGDGGEVGKLRLTVRNTTRQVLTVDLPEGARLTHCFRDGLPLRPATEEGNPSRVLVPLTRSEQQGPAKHVVEPGDTLSGIALRYRGDGSGWRAIADANGVDPSTLAVGMVLDVPVSADGAAERSFVLELAWERRAAAVSAAGFRTLSAPTLDLEVMSADWHVYLPENLEVVWTSTDLVLDGRKDLFHRLIDGLVLSTTPGETAWAGGDGGYGSIGDYSNILSNRRALYKERQKNSVEQRTDPFPLVGRKHALHGTLLGTEPLLLSVVYLDRGTADWVRTALFALSALSALAFAWRPQAKTAVVLALVLCSGLLLGMGLIGSWSQLLWGINLGLLPVLARNAWSLPQPVKHRLIGAATIAFVSSVLMCCSGSPLLISLVLLSGVSWTAIAGRSR